MNTKTQIHFYNYKTPFNQRYVNLKFNHLSHSMNKTSLFNSKNLNLKTSTKFFLKNSEKKINYKKKSSKQISPIKLFNKTTIDSFIKKDSENKEPKNKTKSNFYLANLNYFKEPNSEKKTNNKTTLPIIENTRSKSLKKQIINPIKFKSKYNLDELISEIYRYYNPAKHSLKSFDSIISYGVNTYRGIVRNYNEDRVSIVVNVKNTNPAKYKEWPNISFFGIYDGHAGDKCSEYLKNNLHHYIFNSSYFPEEPLKAMEYGFQECEKNFFLSIKKSYNTISDYSGSCALIIIIINNMCYCANLGDSRAIYSYDSGKKFYQISRDHKPNDNLEKKRIIKGGGSVFKTSLAQFGFQFRGLKESDLGFKLPYRINPGRLSVKFF
jgi:hypothetical protein